MGPKQQHHFKIAYNIQQRRKIFSVHTTTDKKNKTTFFIYSILFFHIQAHTHTRFVKNVISPYLIRHPNISSQFAHYPSLPLWPKSLVEKFFHQLIRIFTKYYNFSE